MNPRYLFFFFAFFFSVIMHSQALRVGLRFEPGILFSEQFNNSEVALVLNSYSLNAIYQPVEWLELEVRPGYINNGEFGGFQIGGFSRFKVFSKKLFFLFGFNSHSNQVSNAHNSGGSYLKTMLFVGVGAGYKADHRISFDLTYYWTGNKEYAYSKVTDWLTYSKIENKKMKGIIKIGFNILFTLL